MRKVRRAYGLSYFRRCPQTNQWELLMSRRRYTYAFFSFVMGDYTSANDPRVIEHISGMTTAEKVNLTSLNFDYLWFLCWGTDPTTVSFYRGTTKIFGEIRDEYFKSRNVRDYIEKKKKFETNFKQDSGRFLKFLLARSKFRGELWEIPKGRKKHNSESDLTCSIREFQEETGVRKKMYQLCFDIDPIQYSYSVGNFTFINKYYVAIATDSPKLRSCVGTIVDAPVELRWMKLSQIETLEIASVHLQNIRTLFGKVNKK